MDYYECLPAEYQEVVRINQPKFGYVIPQIKKEAYENSDVESEKDTEVAPVVKEQVKDDDPVVLKFKEESDKLETFVSSANQRVKDKIIMLQELAEKQIQIKRLMKRNKKIEKSIRKRFATLDMDVDFDN